MSNDIEMMEYMLKQVNDNETFIESIINIKIDGDKKGRLSDDEYREFRNVIKGLHALINTRCTDNLSWSRSNNDGTLYGTIKDLEFEMKLAKTIGKKRKILELSKDFLDYKMGENDNWLNKVQSDYDTFLDKKRIDTIW